MTEKATPKVDIRHCGHEWCDCGCYGRPHCKIGCGMDRNPPTDDGRYPSASSTERGS